MSEQTEVIDSLAGMTLFADLTPPQPWRTTKGMGGAQPPTATRSSASMARMASTGPSPQ